MTKHIFTLTLFLIAAVSSHSQATFDFSTANRGPVIGNLHYGIFYEEINNAGDGGIYAELIRNGSMEENGSNPDYWWTLGNATFSISTQNLINGAQTRSMQLNLNKAGDGTRNIGYWGINIVKGQKYKASFWIRTTGNWIGDLTLTLESYEGDDLGSSVVHVEEAQTWKKYTIDITATGSYQLGWFAIRGSKPGTIYLDCVSLFPPTYKDRDNGMRKDLAEKLEALHPQFMRFPGGCYIEGGNRYQWRNTVGPVENRIGLYNSNWGYPVSNGMGYHEFLQLAEDIGAEPLFVVNVGMGHGWYENYQHIEGYIQEALDALEYANGDASTFWGAQRVAMGHPEPFNLRMLEIGNENYNFNSDNNSDQSDHYAERFKQFYDAIKAKYPDVICIGNVESWGTDNPSWRNKYAVEMVDEHYYRSPDWFAANYHKYDNFSRTSHKIYNGEYAVTSDFGNNGTLKAALGEAIYMAGMERNSDVCVMASYAPIFMNENQYQWRPDMIHYNAYSSFGTPSYWAQQMMASNVGHQNITWTETNNTVSIENAKLAVGSWGTNATYSNIVVTNSQGDIIFSNPGKIESSASTYGNSKVFDCITDDCTIEMDAVKNSGNEGFLVTFAYKDDGNYAWWNLGGWNNGQHGIEQTINGSKSLLTGTAGSITTGKTYHLKIERDGLNVRCFIDDQLIQSATLSKSNGQKLYVCASLNETEDAAILKVINYTGNDVPSVFTFSDAKIAGNASARVMYNNDNYAENSMDNQMNVCPRNITIISTGGKLSYTVPAYSLNVITVPLSDVSEEKTTQPDNNFPTVTLKYSFEEGKPQDDYHRATGDFVNGATVMQLNDGNHALFTGNDDANGYFNLGNVAAQAIGRIVNNRNYTISTDIMIQEGGHFNSYCWAWNVNNSTANYIGLVNQANNGNWYGEIATGTTTSIRSHSGLSQNKWHNISLTCENGTMKIYVDGELRNTAMQNSGSLNLTNTTNAWIGRSPFSADPIMTNTWFDNIAIYDKALTSRQIMAMYNATKSLSAECDALVPTIDTTVNPDAEKIINGGKWVEITPLLTNPDFSAKNDGWEGTSFSAAPGTVAEHYYKVFDTYQILHNMPAGLYRLQWQGFYRNGNIENAYLRYQNEKEDLAEVYANEHATNMASIYSDKGFTYSPYNYPDNVSTAETAFKNGKYLQQMDFQLDATADLRIGIRKFTPCTYDWMCCDNFRLYYIGDDPTEIRGIPIELETTNNKTYDINGREVKNQYQGIIIQNGKKILLKAGSNK